MARTEGRGPRQETAKPHSRVSDIAEKARESATQVRDQVGQAQERAGEALEAAREKTGNAQAVVADRLDAGADTIRKGVRAVGFRPRAGGVPGRVAVAGKTVAGRLENSAYWLRENDLTDLRELIGHQLREHPGRTALLALGIGLFVGRSSKR